MYRTFPCLILIVTLLGCSPSLDTGGWEQTPGHERLAGLMVQVMSRNPANYRLAPLDDALASRIVDAFAARIDPSHLFLTKASLSTWSPHRKTLDDALLDTDLDPVWAMAQDAISSIRRRLAWVQEEVGMMPAPSSPTHFSQPRDFLETQQELDAAWRTRLAVEWQGLARATLSEHEIRTALRSHYASWQARLAKYGQDQVLSAFLNAYTDAIDPHAEYLTPSQFEDLAVHMRLYSDGIGVSLVQSGPHAIIETVYPGSPAERSGQVVVGSRLLAIEERDAVVSLLNLPLDEVASRLRGKPGSSLVLTLLPPGEEAPIQVDLTRETVQQPDRLVRGEIVEVASSGKADIRVGLVSIPIFYRDLAADAPGARGEFRQSGKDLEKVLADLAAARVDGLLIDLRQNNGGALPEAIHAAGLFAEDGPLIQTKDAYGQVRQLTDQGMGAPFGSIPTVVLVSRNTASAAEVFAAALQDRTRAVVVGEQTYGKGTIQGLLDLDIYARTEVPIYGQVKLTLAEFFRVTGKPVQWEGVVPDVVYPINWGAAALGEKSLAHALPPSTIEPSPAYTAPARLDLSAIKEASLRRTTTDTPLGRFTALVRQQEGIPPPPGVQPRWPEEADDIWLDEAMAILAALVTQDGGQD